LINKLKKIAFISFALLIFSGCTTTKSETAENYEPNILDVYGAYEGGEYVNKYYGFKLDIPESYTIHDDETKRYVEELGSQVFDVDGESSVDIQEIMAVQTYNILLASKYAFGEPVEENILFQLISENLTYSPGVENGEDYLWHVKKLLKEGGLNIIDESETATETINGVEFYTYSYGMVIQGSTIYQNWFCKKVNDHMVCFALSSVTDEGYAELYSILNTLELLDQTSIN